jgi:hypothetical protein
MFLPRRSFEPAFPDVQIYDQASGGANALTRKASAIVRADVIDLGCELIHGSFDEQELAALRAALLAKRGGVTRGRFVLAGSPWEANSTGAPCRRAPANTRTRRCIEAGRKRLSSASLLRPRKRSMATRILFAQLPHWHVRG